VDRGNPICSCPRGKTGNPFVRCIPDGEKCTGNLCGPNSGCRMLGDRPVCYCLPRFGEIEFFRPFCVFAPLCKYFTQIFVTSLIEEL